MKNLVITIFLLFMTACNATRYIEVEREIPIIETRVEYKDKLIYDSIYMRDSIFSCINGDTIYLYKEKTNTRYIYRTDTLVLIDSIPYPIKVKETEVKEVNRTYWWLKLLMCIGAFAILISLIVIVEWLKIKLKL